MYPSFADLPYPIFGDHGDRVLVIVNFSGTFGDRRRRLRRDIRFRQLSREFSVANRDALTIAPEFRRTAVHSAQLPGDDRICISGSLEASCSMSRCQKTFRPSGPDLFRTQPWARDRPATAVYSAVNDPVSSSTILVAPVNAGFIE